MTTFMPAFGCGPVSPQQVTRGQAKIAMARAGLTSSVEALLNQLPADHEVRIWWDEALTFNRYSPSLLAMAEQLGLSDQALNQLFIAAAQIEG
jgi:hypothetical protein